MKLRKILLTTGILATTIAPIATVVSCGPEPELHPEWKKENDEKWNGNGQDELGILNSKQINNMKADLVNFPISAADVFEWSVNSPKQGIMTNIVRLQDFATNPGINYLWTPANLKWTPLIDNLIDTTTAGENGAPQSIHQTSFTEFENINALWSKKISKNDIISNADILETAYAEINKLATKNPNDRIGVFSVADKEDEQEATNSKYTTGEYTIYAFKLKPISTNSQINNAKNLLKDKTKMSLDMNVLRKFGGTYLTGSGYGTVRFDSDPNSGSTIFPISANQANNSPDFNDRAAGSTSKDWFVFGPTIKNPSESESNWISNVNQQEMDNVNNVQYIGYYVKDQKTKVQYLVFSAVEGALDQNTSTKILDDIDTIYLPMPEIMEMTPQRDYSTFSDPEIDIVRKSITNDLSFSKIYNILLGVESLKGMIGPQAPSAMVAVINLYEALPFMYQSQNIISGQTPFQREAFKRFLRALPTIDPTFNLATFMQIIEWQKGKNLETFMSFGGKRYQILDLVPRFYGDLKTFVDQNPDLQKELLQIVESDTAKTGGQNG